MHGNVWTWCLDRAGTYGSTVQDLEDTVTVIENDPRVLRGGSFLSNAFAVRSANRNYGKPENPTPAYGFRVARTY